MSPAATIPSVTYAVGDIHGCSDLLKTLLAMIMDHRAKIEGTAKIVFLGDYVDRGPDAKGVLEILWSKQLRRDFNEVIVLKGNHELMLIEEIDQYEASRHENVADRILARRLQRIAKISDLNHRTLRNYLRKLPSYHSDGTRLFTHAGIAPGMTIEALSEQDLLWYRGPVEDIEGRLVVHGHTPVLGEPQVTKHAVNIDTMAYGSSQLTCAVFKGKSRKATFLWTPPNEDALLDIKWSREDSVHRS
jgi:serine/threonine protein phosphatase 1